MKKVTPLSVPFSLSASEFQRMSPYAQYLIDRAVEYEDEVLLGDGSNLCPECTVEIFVMNSMAHGYHHSSVSVAETGDIEALTKMVGMLETAKIQAVQRILELESENLN